MANQPPTGRPWFRLASQVLRESTPLPQPVQPPQGPPIRQLVTQPSAVLPPQPRTPPTQPPPTAVLPPQPRTPPTQPPPTAVLPPQPRTPPTQPPPPPPPQPSLTPSQGESKELAPPSAEQPKQPSSPLPPLKPIKTSLPPPPQSPKVKSPSPTPTPSPKYDDRTLKPSPEPEVKTIPEAQPKSTTNNGKGEPHKNARNSEPKLGTSHADTRGPPPSPKKEAKKKDEGDMRMITIAGDNIGAYMDLGPSYSLHSRKQQKQKSNGSLHKQGQGSDSATEDGKSSDKNGARDAAAAAAKAKPMTSLVNSNVQSVNNSIIFNGSCTQRSPGVHIALANHRNPNSKAHPPPQ